MFDIGWGELVVIGIVALVVIGPKELPTVLRTIGQWTAKVRRMAAEFQGQFQEAMREAEFAELKKQVDAIGEATRDIGNITSPLDTARREMESALGGATASTASPPPPAPLPERADEGVASEPLLAAPPVEAQVARPADASPAPAAPADVPGAAPRAPAAPEHTLPHSPEGGRAP